MHLAPHIGRLIVPKDSRSSRRPFDEIVSGKRATPPARESVKNRGAKESQKREPGAPSKTESSKSAGSKASGYRGRRYQEPNRFWNYPRPNKGPVARWLPSWRFLLASILGIGILGIGIFIAAYLLIDVPEPEDVATAESTTVYYADGETEMGQFATIRRHIIDTSELPDHVGDAIVASEDRRFYSNAGVDPVGIVRAFINNITGGKRQGGSTITQQYVERYYTGDNLGYRGKFKEAILALKIDRQQSKEQILGNYMNTIYFGRGANGIEQAAIEYFDKPASELTISESAMLAGIIPSPSNWDPAVSPEMAEQRWNRTLDLMVTSGFLTQAERDEQEFPDVKDPGREDTFKGPQGYLLRSVSNELVNTAGFEEEDIKTGGYQIVTTIDHRLQEAAIDAAESLPEDRAPNLRVGLISLDNETGGIRAMYGGEDYLENSLNAATQAVAQGGSTFKVFTLAAALESGVDLGETFPSYSPMDINGWQVQNYDHSDRGRINLLTATQHSVNTTYALLNSEIGADKTKEMAIRLGLPENTSGLEDDPANVLGSASPHVIDTAHAFSTIANGGNKTTPHIVDYVETPDGAKSYTGPTTSEEVLDPQVAADVTYAMTQVVQGGTGKTANALGRPVAGKTGSSSWYKSAWFAGFVPQLTTAVALFQPSEDGKEEETLSPIGGVEPVAGGTWPTTVWTQFMLEAVKDLPVEEFPAHSTITAPTPTYTPTPTQTPTEEESEEPEEEEPSEEPSEEPEEEPSEEPSEEPTDDPDESEEPTDGSDDSDEGEGTPSQKPTDSTGPPEQRPGNSRDRLGRSQGSAPPDRVRYSWLVPNGTH